MYETIERLRLRGVAPWGRAMDWLRARPVGETPAETYLACQHGDWLLWLIEAAGGDVRLLGYACAERARQSALRALDAAGVTGSAVERLRACAPVTDAASAAAAEAEAAEAEAAAEAAARWAEARWAAAEAAAAAAAAAAAEEAEAAAEARWGAREGELAAIAELVRAEWPWPRVAPLLGVTS